MVDGWREGGGGYKCQLLSLFFKILFKGCLLQEDSQDLHLS